MGKIRPKRIVEGFAKKVLPKEEIPKNRLAVCSGCPLLEISKLGIKSCGVCGCEVDAKTNVLDEYCPANRWDDIKMDKDVGIAVRVKEPSVATVELEDDRITVTYKESFKHGSNTQDTKLELEIINARGDFDYIPKQQKTLTDIEARVCSCFNIAMDKNMLRDGQSLNLSLMYNTQLNTVDIEKQLKIITAQDVLYINLKAKMSHE
jgi:hypothetical protein